MLQEEKMEWVKAIRANVSSDPSTKQQLAKTNSFLGVVKN